MISLDCFRSYRILVETISVLQKNGQKQTFFFQYDVCHAN